MSEPKTKPTRKSVTKFIDAIENEARRADAKKLLAMMKKVTGEKPVMWGDSIVGFGTYHYKYKSGREGDWMLTAFSPRKTSFSIYIMSGFNNFGDELEKLGKCKHSVSCLYVKKLDDIDMKVLERMVRESVKVMKKRDWSNCG